MNLFIIGSPYETAKILDHRRLNKQIIECMQMHNANIGLSNSWKNHPATLSYKSHLKWMELYRLCLTSYRAGDDISAKNYSDEADKIRPEFHNEEFFNQMKRRLFTKDNVHYKCFEKLGESDVNWYYVNNEIMMYRNGKKLNYK